MRIRHGALCVIIFLIAGAAHSSVPIFGPKNYTIPANQELTVSETVLVPPGPCANDSAVYTLVVTNGNADGSGKVTSGALTLNGQSIVGDELHRGLATIEKPILLTATNTLALKFSAGDSNAVATIAVRRQMTTPVFAEKTYALTSSDSATFREDFSVGAQQPGPYTLILTNGAGSDLPADDVSIVLNGSEIISKKDIVSRGNSNIAQILLRAVPLVAQNSLRIDLRNNKVPASVKLRIVRPVADTAGPAVVVAGPQSNAVVGNAAITLTGTATDPIGVSSFRINATSVTLANDGSFQQDIDLNPGANTIAIDATDCEGNASHQELLVYRDAAPPQISITSPVNNAILASGAVTITGTASDDIAVASVAVNGQAATLAAASWTVSLTFADGSRSINAVATDRTGKQNSATITIVVDTTPPSITATVSPTPNAAGWNHDDVTVTFACSDSGSGVATCSAPITISSETASQVVTGTAVDKAGNSNSATATLKLDKSGPVVAIQSPAPGSTLSSKTQTITGTVADPLSGIQSLLCGSTAATISGGTFACDVTFVEGANDLTILATDRAGNATPASAHYTVITDAAPPSITISSPPDNGFSNVTTIDVTGTASDDKAVASVTVNGRPATIDGIKWKATLTFDAPDGPRQIVATAKDTAAKETTATISITIDTTPPLISATVAPLPNAAGWNTTDPTVTFQCSDATSGMESCTAPVTVTQDGVRPVPGVAIDKAGNVTVLNVDTKVDTTGPEIIAIPSPDPSADGWFFAPNVTVGFQCNDGLSGVTSCSGPQTFTSDGVGQLAHGEAVDAAGNRSTVSFTVNADRTAPTLSVIAPPAVVAATQLTLQGTVSDSVSGLKSLTCNALPAAVSASSFTCTIPIGEGANTIAVIAIDRTDNETHSDVSVLRDTTAPFLSIDSPISGGLTNGSTITIKGHVADVGGLASLTAAGQSIAVTDSAFTLDVPLAEGANNVEFVATDRAGNMSRLTSTTTRFTVPSVTITSPADLALVRTVSVAVRGSVSAGVTSVSVNGIQATLTGNTFAVPEVPLSQGRTVVTATASSVSGAVATASVNIYRDSIPPRLDVYSPKDAATVYTPSVSISGMVDDIVVGTINAGQVRVNVNGIEAEVANRAFLLSNVPLAPGTNTLLITAIDQGGNSTVLSYHITYATPPATAHLEPVSGNGQRAAIGALLAEPVVVRVVDGSGNAQSNKTVTFNVLENDGQLSDGVTSGRSVSVVTNSLGQASIRWTLGTRAGAGNNRIEARGTGLGVVEFAAVATTGQPHLIVVDSGNDQFAVVNAALPRPLVAVVVDSGSNRLANVPVKFTVTRGGGTFDGQNSITLLTDSDGRAIALPVLGPLPGQDNHRFSASIAGVATTANFHASGRTAGPAADTKISGVILDNTSLPVPGVTVRVEGTSLMTQSDGQGQFLIKSAPVGYAKLVIDGSTAQRPGTWPMLEFSMFDLPGNDNTIGMPIYLLPVDVRRGLQVNETTGGTLTLPELPGFSLTVAPGSVLFPGGSRTGTVSVTLVHADKMPMTPGFGQQPRFLVTIQPPGAHFDPPAAITFPNVDGLAPGSVTEMYSFDHDLGQFVAIGTGSVSADGTVLKSDPGVGIIKGGWHCGGNPALPGTSASCPECQTCDGENCSPDSNLDGSGCTPKNKCVGSAFCQNGVCQQIPKTCPTCNKCVGGNCGPDQDQNGGTCLVEDKCIVDPKCVDGICTGVTMDLESWKDDTSFGGEIKMPPDVMDKINTLFSHLPWFKAGKLDEITVGGSAKSKDCCEPTSGRVKGGIKEKEGKVTVTAKLPLPVGYEYDLQVLTGTFVIDVSGEAALEVTPSLSVGGSAGLRQDNCKKESCVFGTVSADGAIDVTLKLSATACIASRATSTENCLGKIEVVPAGVKVKFATGIHFNEKECGSGASGFLDFDKILLHAEFTFHAFGIDWKYEYEKDFLEAYHASF